MIPDVECAPEHRRSLSIIKKWTSNRTCAAWGLQGLIYGCRHSKAARSIFSDSGTHMLESENIDRTALE